MKENEGLIEYNNHKKAKTHHEIVTSTVTKEIEKGWVLVLPLPVHCNLPHSMICPIGIADQVNYMEDGGSTSIKNRITHNQTFRLLEGSKSVNSLADMTWYPNMINGFCYLRMVHQIVSLRHHHPNKRILLFLWDYKSACSRVHYDSKESQMSMARINDLL
jgi:hypothetical protein